MVELHCKTCSRYMGTADFSGDTNSLSSFLPPYLRGATALIPKDTNIARALTGVLTLECAACRPNKGA